MWLNKSMRGVLLSVIPLEVAALLAIVTSSAAAGMLPLSIASSTTYSQHNIIIIMNQVSSYMCIADSDH